MYGNTNFIRFYKKMTSFAVVLAMCSTFIQGVTVSAEDILFNLSGGAIRIESGTSLNTIKVIQGDVTKDNLPEETQVTITGTYSSNSGDAVYVVPGIEMNVKLSNTNIVSPCAFNMSGSYVNLELSGENTLQSSNDENAGLKVSGGASVFIYGDGSLTTGQSGYCGTGIGGDSGNITIDGGIITAIGYWGAGIGVGSGNITINGGTVNATGRYGAGIGGMGWCDYDVNVTINGGTINANGGSYAAGIGSGYCSGSTKNGSITINGGTITARGECGAAIGGGGYDGLSCPIAINGGVVTAGTIGGAGSYSSSPDNGAFTMNGNAIVFASSVSDSTPKTKGILFNGNNGVMYGNVTVEHDVTISNNMALALHKGDLTIDKGAALTNNGTILLGEGTSVLYGGDTYGILTGSGQTRNMVTIAEILGIAAPVPGATPATTITETSQYTGTVKWLPAHNVFQKGTSYTATVTLTAKPGFVLTGVPANFFTVTGATAVNSVSSGVITAVFSATNVSNSIFDITGGAIRIEKGTNTDTFKVLCGGSLVKDNISKETQVTITGSCSNLSGDGIYVAPGVTANIMLCDANINFPCAFNMSGAIVNLELAGENSLRSNDSDSAGLRVPVGASVTVYGEGKLMVSRSSFGAGIGGNSGESGGDITINNGIITVIGDHGAGIGGGMMGAPGNITINGGVITASGGSYSAAIGGGYSAISTDKDSIIINGGTITATGSYGAAIGSGGYDELSCPITINGGIVNANSIGGTGSYKNSPDNGAFTMNGNAVVIASSVSDNSPKTKGILFNGNSGVMYGDVTVEQDLTIPNNRILALREGTLTIAKGVTLTNNGIIVLGKGSSILNGDDIYGTLTGGGKTQNMVSITEIKGVPAPVPGEVPVTIVTESSYYTGTVQWSPAHKVFQAGVGYTATITLTAKPYFVFTGVPANFFTLTDASSVKNNADSGVVTAVFSATDAKNNCFDLSDGPIRVENGSSFNTLKIKYGRGLVKDYLSPNTQITITGNYLSDSNSTVDAIYVSQAANIKMDNVNISVNASNRSAFNIDNGSVTLELIGENILKSGSGAAGLRVPAESTLTINGNGSLTSTGNSGGAGIGGNSTEACGAVTINGGMITTQSDSNAMGIGSGSGSSNGGKLTINGDAIVFASSLSDNSPKTKGILFNGNIGMMYGDVTVEHDMTISNDMRLLLNTGTLTIAEGNTITNNGIILLGEGASFLYGGDTYGTLTGSGQTQNMVSMAEILGVSAPVPGAAPVTTITETPQYTGTVKWLPAHSQFKAGTSYIATITLTAKPGFVLTDVPANFFTVAGITAANSSGSGVITAVFSATNVGNSIFDITEGAIRIEKGTNKDTFKVLCGSSLVKDNISKETQITITGNYSDFSGDGIYVAPGVTANIMLCNANINASCAFNMSEAIVNLELAGENTLKSNESSTAGLRVPAGASITTFGEGSLTTRGGAWGAGFGGNNTESAGNITINGGTIIAHSSSFGAAIGGGAYGGSGGNITINSGKITTYGNHGAGIGGGLSGLPGKIIINGGTIIASGSYGAGIGGGYNSSTNIEGSITINGGTITATGRDGAAIGSGGYDGLSCPITINGGMVNANRIGGTGSYSNSPDNGAFTMNGNAVVIASSVSDNSPKAKGILFIGNSGTVYGNVTLEENTTIPSGKTLTIPNSSSLLIPEEVTLTNNGTVTPSNGSTMTVLGSVSGKKIDGANVTALSENKITHNSVALNSADLLAATGQSVEYAFSTSNFVPSSDWQNTPYFTALNPDTTYYFFARSREDTNFHAGMTSSLPVTVQDSVYSPIEILPIGDVDGSGTINSVDFAYMRMHLLGKIKDFEPDDDLWVSDVNGDGTFNSIDFGFMRQFLLGKIEKFPKQKPPYVKENGDTKDSAIVIEAGDKISSKIDHVGDFDYFSFTPSETAIYGINTKVSEGSVNEILLYDFEGISNSEDRIIYLQNSSLKTKRMFVGQTYYLAIEQKDNLTSYSFSISKMQDDHGNDFKTATSLNSGLSEGIIESSEDVDFFSYTAQNSDDYIITISTVIEMDYCVYTSLGKEILGYIPYADKSNKNNFRIPLESNKTYYIKLKPKISEDLGPYNISISPMRYY